MNFLHMPPLIPITASSTPMLSNSIESEHIGEQLAAASLSEEFHKERQGFEVMREVGHLLVIIFYWINVDLLHLLFPLPLR